MGAQTTTAINGCDAGIWADIASGVLTDIGGSSNEYNLEFDMDIAGFRTFGNRWQKRLDCGKDAKLTVMITYSTAVNEGIDLLKNWFFNATPGERTIRLYVPAKNVGADVYSAEWRLESLKIPVVAGEAKPVTVTAVLLPSGPVTLTVNAT